MPILRYCLMLVGSLLLGALPMGAENTIMETIRVWNVASYSQTTIDLLAADTEHWAYNSKGRYQNTVKTDGELLKASGEVIPETDGLYIGAGIDAGSLLLRHAMGNDNGVQMQRSVPVSIKSLKAGQELSITMKSSSKDAHGIASVSNLEGECGQTTYTTTSFKTYTFTVKQDGDVSWTNSGGIVFNRVVLKEERNDEREQVSQPVVSLQSRDTVVAGTLREIKTISLSCATPDAAIYYSIIDYGTVYDYQQEYTLPFSVNRSVRLRAYATKNGMSPSEVLDEMVEVPLVMPFEHRPWRLDPEPLDRGAVAVKIKGTSNNYLITWRRLIDDPADIRFNVYGDGQLLNTTPLNNTNLGSKGCNEYRVDVLIGDQVVESSPVTILPNGYWDIPIQRPQPMTTQSGTCYYVPGDCMVADVDGDKQYEVIMKWDPSNTADGSTNTNDDADTAGQKDNSISGYTGNVYIDGYRLDGTHLWRIDLGCNIRAGAHYTQLMVYDLDGDGCAELACKTAPGTIDGKGNYVLMGNDDPTADYRTAVGSKSGMIISGPEYLTVFSGLTGEALATTAYQPARSDFANWGDSYGNRSERYLACVAYLDGQHPSLVMCKGYYTAAFLWAVDFDGQKLSTRWLHRSIRNGYDAWGEGAHGISTADVDGDGCDEIVYGSCSIDHDGSLLYRTGLGHGDALHVGDLDPDRPGLEVMMVHEDKAAKYGIEMREALSGKIISGTYAGSDVGRGVCADIDASHRGCEYWGYGYSVWDVSGSVISTVKPAANFRTYWDGDLQEELTERGVITKWKSSGISTLVDMPSTYGVGTDLIKYTPCLQADIFGDWREEQIYYDKATCSHLMIFSTWMSSSYSLPCLMHDHHYRMATVWQTSAYNQPPHLSYFPADYLQYLTKLEGPEAMPRTVVEVRFHDLGGRRLPSAPREGFYIEERLFDDGAREWIKKIR